MKKEVTESLAYLIIYVVLVYFKPRLDAWRKKRKVSISKSVSIIEQVDNHCYYLVGLLGVKNGVSVYVPSVGVTVYAAGIGGDMNVANVYNSINTRK